MGYCQYNPNPNGSRVGDCSVRAISKALNTDWKTAYMQIALQGYEMYDMPSSNAVWGAVLKKNGFVRDVIPNECPDYYNIEDFCIDNPRGTFIIAVKNHVVTVQDGNLFDSWNSSAELPLYYWRKE